MATVTNETRTPLALPRAIRRGLGRVDHRLRTLGALRGLGTLALILAIGAAVGMALDVAFVLPMSARWTIWRVGGGGMRRLAGGGRPADRQEARVGRPGGGRRAGAIPAWPSG